MNVVIKRYAAGKGIQERMELQRLWDQLARRVLREKKFSEGELPHFGRVALMFIAEMRRQQGQSDGENGFSTDTYLDPNYGMSTLGRSNG